MSALLKPLPELTVTVQVGRAYAGGNEIVYEPEQMTRQELADALRDARYFRGERRTDTSIGLSVDGWSIYDWRR